MRGPPKPKALAPASVHASMLSMVMPPVGTQNWLGNGSRMAFSNAGPKGDAGKSFNPSHPAAIAVATSVGVITPGS